MQDGSDGTRWCASRQQLGRRRRAPVTISSLRGPPQARMDNEKRRRPSPPRIDEGRVVSSFGTTDAGAVETRRSREEAGGVGCARTRRGSKPAVHGNSSPFPTLCTRVAISLGRPTLGASTATRAPAAHLSPPHAPYMVLTSIRNLDWPFIF